MTKKPSKKPYMNVAMLRKDFVHDYDKRLNVVLPGVRRATTIYRFMQAVINGDIDLPKLMGGMSQRA